MVFADRPPENESVAINLVQKTAPVTDRMLAFAFDLCLWSPLALLLTKPLWRDFQYHQTLSPGSDEAVMFFAMGLFFSGLFLLVIQTLCVWRWGATPGKRIFMMEVVGLQGQRLSLGASLTRAATQLVECLCLGIPYLEVLSHAERRPWHDRMAESRVISHKTNSFRPPHFLESRFFRNLYWGFAMSALMLVGGALMQLHHQAKLAVMKHKEMQDAGYLCEQDKNVPERAGLTRAQSRLDYALAQFEAGLLSHDCLESEADFAIWTQADEITPWAYLIRAVLSQEQGVTAATESETQEHLKQACPEANADVICGLVAIYKGEAPSLENSHPASRSWTGQILGMKQAVDQGEFENLRQLASQETWPKELLPFVQELSLKSLFFDSEPNVYQAGLDLLMPAWSATDRLKQAAWTCFSQTTKACGRGSLPESCQQLRTALETAPTAAWTRETTLTVALEMSCFHRQDPFAERQIEKQFADDEKMNWVLALPRPQSLKAMSWLAQLTETPSEHWARPYLLWWTGRMIKTDADLENLAIEFQKSKRSDPSWWLAYAAWDEKAPSELQRKERRTISSVVEDPPPRHDGHKDER